MAKLNPPHRKAVADVRDEDVDRYLEAGWTKADPPKKSTGKKSTKSSE